MDIYTPRDGDHRVHINYPLDLMGQVSPRMRRMFFGYRVHLVYFQSLTGEFVNQLHNHTEFFG